MKTTRRIGIAVTMINLFLLALVLTQREVTLAQGEGPSFVFAASS